MTRYEKECQAGNDNSCLRLVDIYFQGRDGNIGYPMETDASLFKTVGYLGSSCKAGNASSCIKAAEMLEHFSGIFSAAPFFENACKLGSQQACNRVDR